MKMLIAISSLSCQTVTAFAALVLLVISCAFETFAQDDIIRVSTDLVTIPATVLDRDGRFLADLTKANFRIFEDGKEQELTFFSTVEQPFTVYILLDRSGSMIPHLQEMADAAGILVKQLRPDDQVIVGTFADYTESTESTESGSTESGSGLQYCNFKVLVAISPTRILWRVR